MSTDVPAHLFNDCVTAADIVMGGDVLRIVLGGLPVLKSAAAVGALQELREEHEEFRRASGRR